MTFTPELPKEPGAFYWKEYEDGALRLVRVDRWIGGALAIFHGASVIETVAKAGGLWHRLHSGDEVAELRQEIATLKADNARLTAEITKYVPHLQEAAKLIEELTADNARLAREIEARNCVIGEWANMIARLREEVGRAFYEGVKSLVDTFNTGVPSRYDQSRAKRVASGEVVQ